MFTENLEDYREEALQASDDFGYGKATKERLLAAKTAKEISDIMCKARHATL